MRPDGKRLKNDSPMHIIESYIMNKRVDSANMISLDIPIEPIKKYLNDKRAEGIRINHMDVIIAAYLRTLAEFPALNRFIVNRKAYARNEICVAMVVLQPGDMTEGTMSKMYFEADYTIFQVHDTIEKYVNENREAPESNSTEKMMKFLVSFPGLVPLGVGIFKFLDKHGLLPKSIIDVSPFHSSLLISNLASIRTNHIYHHCYEFGTTSLALTMGNMHEVPTRKSGDIVFERCLPLGLVMDERICSGSYFAMAFHKMQTYLKDPTILENPAENVVSDPAL